MRFTWILVLLFSLALTPTVEARRKRMEGLHKRRLKRKKAKRRGSIKKMGKRKVRVAGRKDMSIKDLAGRALKRHRAMQKKMRKARRGLRKDAVIEEEAIETEDATLLVAKLSAVVVDPAIVKAAVPELASLQGGGARSKIRYSQLEGEALQNFNDIKAELATKPADHPLRVAMGQGNDALLDAMAQGKGDVEVTTTVVVPKLAPMITNGVLQIPQLTDAGFNYSALTPLRIPPGTGDGRLLTPLLLQANNLTTLTAPDPTPQSVPLTTKTGIHKTHHKYVLGRTESGHWEWEDKWSFLNADVTISAGAAYGVGLRIPVRVNTETDPRRIVREARNDKGEKYTVRVTAKTLNGNLDFYREAQVPGPDRHEGKELVMNASVWFKVRGVLDLWLDKVKRTVDAGVGFDYGKHFTPPHGDCGRSCGFDFWIPASITRTDFDVAVVDGSAQIGFWVSGDGEISMDYESYYGPDRIKSKHQGEEKFKHRFRFPTERERSATTTLTTMTMAQSNDRREKNYGYRLSAPEYEWNVDVTPGLKGNLTVDLGVWDHRFNLGPWWFDWAKLDLGKLDLNRHKGSKAVYKELGGTKVWKRP